MQLPLNCTTRLYTNCTTLHYNYNYTTLHYTTLYQTTAHNTTVHYTNYTTPQLQLELQRNYTTVVTQTLQLQLHYTTLQLRRQLQLHYTTLHPAVVVRWPLQRLQPLQKTQLQPPFGPSEDSLCHPWFTTTNLSYRFPIFESSATALRGTTGTGNRAHIQVAVSIGSDQRQGIGSSPKNQEFVTRHECEFWVSVCFFRFFENMRTHRQCWGDTVGGKDEPNFPKLLQEVRPNWYNVTVSEKTDAVARYILQGIALTRPTHLN